MSLVHKVRAKFPKGMSAANKLRTMYPGGQPDECWLWPYGRTSEDYGAICEGGTGLNKSVHVVSYTTFVTSLNPSTNYVLHKCDTPSCWNPAHLYQGTQQVNLTDARAKGRRPR